MSEMSPTIGALAAALSKAQGEILGAVKDSDNPFFKSKYADLAAVIDSKREPFTKNNLSVTQTTDLMDGGLVIVTTILHSSGEWIRGRFPVYLADLKPQVVGSAVTYGRRYALAAACGIAQVDDDAEAAHGRSTPQVSVPLGVGTKARLEEAAASGMDALKAEWKLLPAEERELVAKHHAKWWGDLKSNAKS